MVLVSLDTEWYWKRLNDIMTKYVKIDFCPSMLICAELPSIMQFLNGGLASIFWVFGALECEHVVWCCMVRSYKIKQDEAINCVFHLPSDLFVAAAQEKSDVELGTVRSLHGSLMEDSRRIEKNGAGASVRGVPEPVPPEKAQAETRVAYKLSKQSRSFAESHITLGMAWNGKVVSCFTSLMSCLTLNWFEVFWSTVSFSCERRVTPGFEHIWTCLKQFVLFGLVSSEAA